MGFSSYFSLGFLILYLLCTTSNLGQASAVESTENEASKVKCREHIEEALKQYWDDGTRAEDHRSTISSEDETQENGESGEDSGESGQQDSNADDDDDDDDGVGSVDASNDSKDTVDDSAGDDLKQSDQDAQSEEKNASDDSKDDEKDGDDHDDDDTDEDEEEEEDKDSRDEASKESEETNTQETVSAAPEAVSQEQESEEANKGVEADAISNEISEESKQAEAGADGDEEDDDDDEDGDGSDDNEDEEDDGSEETTEDQDGKAATAEEDDSESKEEAKEPVEEKSNIQKRGSEVSAAQAQDSKKEEEPDESEQVSAEDSGDENSKDDASKGSGEEGDDDDDDDDESEEEEPDEAIRSRSHVEDILKLYEIGTKEDKEEQSLIQSIFRDLKKIFESAVKPMETLYKYRDVTNRLITDAEIFSKPLVMFLGAKGSGKTSLVNYILGLQSTPWQLKTGLSSGAPHFTVITYGDKFTKLSPTELAADFTFSNLQQFGHYFLEHHMHAYRMPISLLQKVTIVDSPGLIDAELGKHQGKKIDSEVYQWFIDRSDVLYIVIDVSQLQMTHQLHSVIDQMKGRDIRFIISKADTVKHSQLILLIGQLLWMLSPVMSADEPPKVYALTTSPMYQYDVFIDDQEQNWLTDLSEQISGIERVESRVAAVRRHAVRVRNHAKLIDAYLGAYYRSKGLFTFGASARKLAQEITENPLKYRVFSGAVAGQSHNISRYDLPDPEIYEDFFRINALSDFKQLSATCSFFKGCPMDKLDLAIAYQLPDLVGKYKKLTKTTN